MTNTKFESAFGGLTANESENVLLVDGAYGVYVPQTFAENFNLSEWGVSSSDWEILKTGPEHPEYWDVWDYVLIDASCTNDEGTWRLEQDGDLWAVKVEVGDINDD